MNGLGGIEQATLAAGYAGAVQPVQDFAQELHKQSNEHAPPPKPAINPGDHQAPGVSISETPGTSATAQATVTDATAASAQHDIAATSAQVIAPVTPIGVTEAFLGARVFGLHLSAQGYLSELKLLDWRGEAKGETADATALERDAATIVAAPVDEPVVPSMPSVASNQEAGAAVALPLSIAEVFAGRIEPVHNVDTAAPAIATAGAEAVQWSERALRFSRDGGKGVTAWLRDYRLNENELGPVLGSLTAHAREQGMTLQRVVLNGREVWTSSAHTQGSDYAG